MSRKPIVVKAHALDALADFHNVVRRRWKTREASRDFDGLADWEREGRRRFGPHKVKWRWRCHHCGAVYDAGYAVTSGMPTSQVGFACIGTVEPAHPCTYTGTQPPLNPVAVRLPGGTARMLAFAD